MSSSNLDTKSTLADTLADINVKELKHFPYIHHQVVAWGDMDAFNHVNNIMYYRYAESARIAYLRQLAIFTDSITTVIAKSECNYLAPVEYPDTLLIGTRTKKLGNTSLIMEYHYYSTATQKIVATGEAVLVRLDAISGKPVVWSNEERKQISDYEAAAAHDIND